MPIVTNFCSLCLDNNSELANVDTEYDEDDDGVLIKEKLEFCVPEIVGINREIKKCICIKCLLNLKNFFTFKRACIRSSVTLNECCKQLPFANEPNKHLTLSLSTTNFRDKKTPLFLVKVPNTAAGVNIESNKVVVPTEIKSIKKYVNKKCIKKFNLMLPPAENKKKIETEVEIADNTGVKRVLLPTDVKNKIFQTTNTQTVGSNELKRLLLSNDKNIQKNNLTQKVGNILLQPYQATDKNIQKNNMSLTVGNSLLKPCFLSTDKNIQNITYVQAVGNSVKVQDNRHIEIMPTVTISKNDTVINEIKNEVMEYEDTESQDQRQKNALYYEIVKSEIEDTENQDQRQKMGEKNALNYEIVKSEIEDTENQDGRQKIGENAVSNEDIVVKSNTTSEIDFEDLIQINDIEIDKYKYLYVKGKYPSEKEFKHTYSLSEAQFQQNSTTFEIFIKEDLQTTNNNNQECRNLTSNIFKNVDEIQMKKSTYACFDCNKTFSDVHTLRVHEMIHSGIKEHECKICKKKFSQKWKLDVHENVHIDEKIFECSFCKKKFLHKKHLRLHEKIHIEKQNYECSICKEKFENQINLLYHEKTHNVFNFESEYMLQELIKKN